MRVGILHNPLSGRNKRNPDLFQGVLSRHRDVLISEVHTPVDVLKSMERFAREQVDCVAINGGDGTIQAAMGVLFHYRPFGSMPSLAVLPAGTANLIAGDVGLGEFGPSSLEQLLVEGQSSLPKVTLESRPILRVCFPEEREPLYGMFFGAGAIYHGTQMGLQTKQSIGRLGEWGAGLILIKFFIGVGHWFSKRIKSHWSACQSWRISHYSRRVLSVDGHDVESLIFRDEAILGKGYRHFALYQPPSTLSAFMAGITFITSWEITCSCDGKPWVRQREFR